MSEREYAAWVFDSAPGQGLTITPVGNRQQAEKRVAYGISAKVVYRHSFMPDMPWEEVQ